MRLRLNQIQPNRARPLCLQPDVLPQIKSPVAGATTPAAAKRPPVANTSAKVSRSRGSRQRRGSLRHATVAATHFLLIGLCSGVEKPAPRSVRLDQNGVVFVWYLNRVLTGPSFFTMVRTRSLLSDPGGLGGLTRTKSTSHTERRASRAPRLRRTVGLVSRLASRPRTLPNLRSCGICWMKLDLV